MKKTSLFLMALLLSVGVGITGLATAQVQLQKAPITIVPKKVFVSSQTYVGNLGGVAGADSLCQGLATAAGLTGTFKAFLSDSVSTPATRWSPRGGSFTLRNGQVVANSWNEIITTGKLLQPINQDEYGRTVTPPPYDPFSPVYVWTGTDYTAPTTAGASVFRSASTCNGWRWSSHMSYRFGSGTNWTVRTGPDDHVHTYSYISVNVNYGTVGVTYSAPDNPTNWFGERAVLNTVECSNHTVRIYCFEQ